MPRRIAPFGGVGAQVSKYVFDLKGGVSVWRVSDA
jgi:hypothetical protein